MDITQCHRCKVYLYDTLPTCVKKEIALYDDYKGKHLPKIASELVVWILKVCRSISYEEFCECYANGRMFARRGKSKEEDEFLLNLSIYFQMKRFSSLLKEDITYIHFLLTDSGVLRTKRSSLYDEIPEKYLGLVLPKLYLELHGIHKDHLHPKMVAEKYGALQENEDLYV